MSIIFFGIKRMLNKKKNLIAIYILPIIFSIFIMNMYMPSGKVGIIDKDNTRFTQIFKRGVGINYKVVHVEEKNIKNEIQNGNVNSVIVIDKGFTSDLLNNKSVKLKTYGDEKSTLYSIVNEYINAFIINSKEKYLSSKGNIETFYKNMSNSIYGHEIYISDNLAVYKNKILLMLRFLIMFMLLGCLTFTRTVMDDNKRVFAAPITVRKYIFQNSIVLFILEMFQVLLVFIESIILCGNVMLEYFLPLLMLFAVAIVMFITFSILIRYKFKYGLISNALVIIPMCMLGGCWWNSEFMPQTFQFIAQFMPIRWIVEGMENILFYGYSKALIIDIFIILLFSAAFLFIGTVNKKDLMN